MVEKALVVLGGRLIDAEGKTLIGAVLVGDTSDYSMWHQSVMNAMALPENPETLLFPAAAAGAGPCRCCR